MKTSLILYYRDPQHFCFVEIIFSLVFMIDAYEEEKKNTINSKCMLWKRTNAVLNLTNVLTLFRSFEWRNERTIRRWFNGREGHFFSRLRPNIREKEIIVHNVDGTKAVENAHSIVICTEFVLPERTKKNKPPSPSSATGNIGKMLTIYFMIQ